MAKNKTDKLSSKQMLLAELMVADSSKTRHEYAIECGISDKTVYTWKNLPIWQEYYHALCEKRFKGYEAIAIQKLMENVCKNNQKAIEYMLNYCGYKPTEQQEVQMDATINIDYGD